MRTVARVRVGLLAAACVAALASGLACEKSGNKSAPDGGSAGAAAAGTSGTAGAGAGGTSGAGGAAGTSSAAGTSGTAGAAGASGGARGGSSGGAGGSSAGTDGSSAGTGGSSAGGASAGTGGSSTGAGGSRGGVGGTAGASGVAGTGGSTGGGLGGTGGGGAGAGGAGGATGAGDGGADLCTAALPLQCGDQLNHSTAIQGRANLWSGYGRSERAESGRETVYAFSSASACMVVATLKNLATDLDLFLLSACDPIRSNTAASSTPLDLQTVETVRWTSVPGDTNYVVVDGYAGAEGSYTLEVDCACQ